MRMQFLAAAAIAAASIAAPAAATIIIYDVAGPVQPDENVVFQVDQPDGNPVFGITNQTGTMVTFTGNEPLTTPSQGQARIEAVDGGLDFLMFALTDPLLGFTEVEFNIFGTRATAENVTLNFTDQFGTVFSADFTIGSGQNFFAAEAIDGQFITLVSFQLDGDVADVRQFRIGGIGEIGVIPEPAAWLLMITGFGMVGASLRRRTPVIAA